MKNKNLSKENIKETSKNKLNLLHLITKNKYSSALMSFLVLSIVIISGLFTFSSIQNNFKTAKAALNCPAGSSVNSAGTGCVSTTPSNYACPGGQTLGGNGAQCYTYGQTGTSYSCPQGGSVSGGSCVATPSTPIDITSNCFYYYPTQDRNAYLIAVPGSGPPVCSLYSSNSGSFPWDYIATPGCPSQYPLLAQGKTQLGFNFLLCTTRGTQRSGAEIISYTSAAGNKTYTATPSPINGYTLVGNATPAYNTAVTSGVTYTPNSGEITGLTCTPASTTTGSSVACSGQATGAPSGVPYSGDVTVSIDNGGGTATVALTSSGTFSTTLTVGTTTGTKIATTDLGGSTSITVIASTTTIDPTLTTGDGSLGTSTDCTTTKSVTLGSVYTCNFPINGTGPFVLPTGGITTKTNETTPSAQNSNTTTDNCTITGTSLNILTCTGIKTDNGIVAGIGNVQLGAGATPTTFTTKTTVTLVNAVQACTTTNPCALFESALTYNPTQANAKRYGASGSTNSADLLLTLKDTRLEQANFTTTCSVKYKFRTDTNYRVLTTNSAYNNSTGCTANLLKLDQLLFNVDFEITAITTNTTTNTVKNYLIYSNYDFKAGSIGVTSIGGTGL